jgi:hypothetical protein
MGVQFGLSAALGFGCPDGCYLGGLRRPPKAAGALAGLAAPAACCCISERSPSLPVRCCPVGDLIVGVRARSPRPGVAGHRVFFASPVTSGFPHQASNPDNDAS